MITAEPKPINIYKSGLSINFAEDVEQDIGLQRLIATNIIRFYSNVNELSSLSSDAQELARDNSASIEFFSENFNSLERVFELETESETVLQDTKNNLGGTDV